MPLALTGCSTSFIQCRQHLMRERLQCGEIGAIRNFEQINAVDSRCNHQYPSDKRSLQDAIYTRHKKHTR
ncbi:hypothetical protein KSD_71180 [Ktedonobacter sp. SOSP1-85]|nr:hypothetical protein KSD_71180 [Ktedonobacter sp. SOSP1-85]